MSTIKFPDIDAVSVIAHQRWIEALRGIGATSERLDETQEELMVPYDQLSPKARDLTRARVMATMSAVEEHGVPSGTEIQHIAETAQDRWIEARRASGVSSEKLDCNGEELMVAFKDLSDAARGLVLADVRGTLEAIEQSGGVLASEDMQKAAG
jgi:hypothetical protein